MNNAVVWDVALCAPVRIEFSEERIVSMFRAESISKLGTLEAIRSSETSVLTRPKWHHIPKDVLKKILHFGLISYRV
jgi:hypothetical protein